MYGLPSGSLILLQIVYFCQSNPGGIVHTPHDCGVISRLQRCDDRGLAWRSRSMPAVLDSRDLTGGNNPADYRMLPIIVAGVFPTTE